MRRCTTPLTFLSLLVLLPLPSGCGPGEGLAPQLGSAVGFRNIEGPVAVLEPAFIDFDRVKVGAPTETEFRLSNVGDEELVVSQAVFQGADGFFFREVGTEPDLESDFIAWAPPIHLAPGEHALLTAHYDPLAGVAASGRLTLYTNEPDDRAAPSLVVQGHGSEECVLAQPAELSFGEVPVGEAHLRAVRLVGCQDTGVRIHELALGGDPAFRLDLNGHEPPSPDAPLSLVAGEEATVYVVFQPIAHSPSEATLEIANSLTETLIVKTFGTGVDF